MQRHNNKQQTTTTTAKEKNYFPAIVIYVGIRGNK